MLSGWNGLAQGCDGEQALPPHGPSRVLLSSIVDALLGGGLRQGQLTEITGQSSSGKTQVKMLTTSIFLNLLDAIDRYTFYMLTPPDKIGLPKTVGF
jgi:hypothetical protein